MINRNFARLENNYLFAEVAARVARHRARYPEQELVSLGIGDVTRPLSPTVAAAMAEAAAEMATLEGFRGYGPYEGYDFLRGALRGYYAARGTAVEAEEIFVGDGAKSDLGAVLSLFDAGIRVLIPDPVYPAYVDANVLAGNRIAYLDGGRENGFLPQPPSERADVVYLCSPNNPTGAVYGRQALERWVDYAGGCGAVLLFDAAYEAFVRDPALPRSIFEIPGARRCAIELGSFSKTAGFTGVRCGYTVIPQELRREGASLHALWKRRIGILYNGAPYVVQRAAAAALTTRGLAESTDAVVGYLTNARAMSAALESAGIEHVGGRNAPYIWVRCPAGEASWDVFDRLLRAGVVCTPGAGFGKKGEGWYRLSAFGEPSATARAMTRLTAALA